MSAEKVGPMGGSNAQLLAFVDVVMAMDAGVDDEAMMRMFGIDNQGSG